MQQYKVCLQKNKKQNERIGIDRRTIKRIGRESSTGEKETKNFFLF